MGSKYRARAYERHAECYEIRVKVGNNAGRKTHKDDNLAKLNDAKCMVLFSPLRQNASPE